MKIYFDTCSIQRPLDDKSNIRVLAESEAILNIITFLENGFIKIVSSDILLYEMDFIKNTNRYIFMNNFLSYAKEFIKLNDEIISISSKLIRHSIKSLDALHIATAEYSGCKYFCTTDDKILKSKIVDLKVKIKSPIELLEELIRWT